MINKIDINKVKPNKNNPRKLEQLQFEKLKKSIKEFQEMLELRPLILDENNRVKTSFIKIIRGHSVENMKRLY